MFIQLLSHKQTIIRHINNTYDIRTQYFENGQIQCKSRCKNGKFHCIFAPALIKYFENGQIEYTEWYKYGKFHRPGGVPAIVKYHENGTIQYMAWYKDGKFHRHGGAPAIIAYFEKTGQVKEKIWLTYWNIILFNKWVFPFSLFYDLMK